ncbi:MAG: GNAT family N-acetyltransferase [Bacteroidetes bacterium]|nr:GNAT family N-acetyltransferase [Bacteroidota bacterium]
MIEIRPYRATDDIDAITEMLHRAYAGLADMGFRFHATFQDADVTRERLNGDLSFMAVEGDTIVGTITLYDQPYDDSCPHYRDRTVARFGQFGIEPHLQHAGLGTRMMDLIEQTAADLGFRELACDTAEGATHLVEWYARRGYRFVEHVQWDVTNYRSVVLSKHLSP